MLTVAGADRVVTVDLHTGQIQGFFDFPVDHLTAVPLLADHMAQGLDPAQRVTVVSPDAGGGKLARRFANCLEAINVETDLAFIDKRRPKGTHNVAVAEEVVGEVAGRQCLLVDDMIDTAGTVVSAAELLTGRGAHSVSIVATHALLSGPAVDRLKNGPIREVVVTNSLPISDEKHFDALRVLSIAPIVATRSTPSSPMPRSASSSRATTSRGVWIGRPGRATMVGPHRFLEGPHAPWPTSSSKLSPARSWAPATPAASAVKVSSPQSSTASRRIPSP